MHLLRHPWKQCSITSLILWEFITQQWLSHNKPRSKTTPSSAVVKNWQPSEELGEQNHTFRLIKHLLILQKLSKPFRITPETLSSLSNFLLYYLSCKMLPQAQVPKGSTITVTDQNQCVLTY
ncbi:hypothetical protein XELAEV_18022445mg [Xenopus laevis]|uniref:Uncharacterized protein n=1 Tax=Xenopus laevis TaxID=8355 RepID=A0A974HN75_XENLA|nr:hypothetical protein XELAEV_18022445mg [Xenopus laevis]